MNDRADPTFGLNPQALAILHMLVGRDPDFATYSNGRYDIEIRTFPWYNSPEKGICLVVRHGFDVKALHITFGENRSTDGIFVDHWEDEVPSNCPTREGVDPEAYEGIYNSRKSFDYGRIGDAADYVMDLVESHYKAREKASKGITK